MANDHDSMYGQALHSWERWVLGLAGIALNATGAIATFATSNQIASAAALLVGSVMFLVAAQGTPVLRAGTDAVELAAKQAARNADTKIEQGRLDDAYDSLEDAASMAPGLRQDPVYRLLTASTFEKAVISTLKECTAGSDVSVNTDSDILDPTSRHQPDALLHFKTENVRVPVEVKYLTKASHFISWAVSTAQDYFKEYNAALLVVNSDEIADRAKNITDERIVVVAWRDHHDNVRIREAINRLRDVAASD